MPQKSKSKSALYSVHYTEIDNKVIEIVFPTLPDVHTGIRHYELPETRSYTVAGGGTVQKN